MYNKMVEENNRKNESLEKNADFSKEHIQKINSAKNIKKEQPPPARQPANQVQKQQPAATIPANKAPPKNPTGTKQEQPKKQ